MGWYEDMIGGVADHYNGSGGSWTGGNSGGGSWWSGLFNSGSDSGGFDWGSAIGGLFGGGDSGGGSNNMWGGILSGLGGAAQAFMDEKSVKEAGRQSRQTRAFEADLLDYYKQKDKYRKRIALDSYGQFSTMNRWAPTYAGDKPIDMPAKPKP